MQKNIVFLALSWLCVNVTLGQTIWKRENTLLRNGNAAYANGSFAEAAQLYAQSLAIDGKNEKAQFNLANAQYMNKQYQEASQGYQTLAENTTNKEIQSKSFHNTGNALLEQKNYDGAIEAYKKALRINPQDADTRYNLAYAQAKKKQEDQQKQQNKDPKEDQNQDKNQQKDEPKKPDNPQQPQQPDKPEDSQPKPQQPNRAISPEEAKRILDALKQEEEKVQQKVQDARQKQNQAQPPNKSNKDW